MLKRFLLLTALLTPNLPAQTTPSPNLAGIAHVALRVANLDASIAFYNKLGFLKAFDLSRDGKVYEAFIKINDHQFIELYPTEAKNPTPGFLHVCFEGNDLQSVHDYYVSKGLTPNAVRTAGAGNLLFTMPGPATPQGPQNMEYTQYMPGSLHSKDFGQHLGPDRISDRMVSVDIAAIEVANAEAFYKEKAGMKVVRQMRASGDPIFVSLLIPGTKRESVHLVPAADLDLKARITLASQDPSAAFAILRKLGVPLDQLKNHTGDRVLSTWAIDPDGNQIEIKPLASDAKPPLDSF